MSNKHLVGFALKGKRSHPDSIGMGELGDLLRHLESAVKASIPPEDRIEHAESLEPLVSLISIVEGNSTDMQMCVLDYALPSLNSMTNAIVSNEYQNIPTDCQAELYSISKWVSQRGLIFQIEEDKELKIQRAVISRQHPVPAPSATHLQVDGPTTLWGYLLRAGGKKPSAALQFPDGTKVTITADEAMAKLLGERLYENMGIEGIGTWTLPDFHLVSFKALRLTEYRPHSTTLSQSFADLAKAAEGRWDNVDASKYIGGLRGKEDK